MIDTSHYEQCREILQKHQSHFRIRLALLFLLLIMNFFVQMYEYVKVLVDYRGFHMAVGTVAVSGAAIIFGLFASPDHPKVVRTLLGILIFGYLFNWINMLICMGLVIVYLTELPECRQAQWVMQQPGYPYFSERFEEQKLHSGFRSVHKLDGRRHAVMQNAEQPAMPPDDPETEAAIQAMRQRSRKRKEQQHYAIRPGETADTMPGVMLEVPDEIPAESAPVTEENVPVFYEPLPEPELPKEEEILLPTWDVPDPDFSEPVTAASEMTSPLPAPLPEPELPKVEEIQLPAWDIPDPVFPDPVTDTSVILSDFPEIAGEIPDLPEIPDIPTI